jgi:MFS family permease
MGTMGASGTPGERQAGTGGGSAGGWAPLRYPDFRRLWTAQFVSNIGSWMQTVAAQWVMVSLTSSAIMLTAISAASSLPVLLLAVPAGALGDLVDRKRLIFSGQLVMLVAAAALALMSAVGGLTPWVLIALLVLIGIGGAVAAPTWQTLQPELVPAEERQPAIALGSVNQNLARAVGPAIGGLLLAATSAALVFGANALSFVAVLGAVVATRIPRRVDTMPREHVAAAVRAGSRFVTNSPVLLALIARAVGFVLFAGSVWAVLPLVARQRLGLGSSGYGLLLGCVGLGALAAASFGPALRQRLSAQAIYALACCLIAGPAVVLALSNSVLLDALVLVLSGAAWITGLGLLSSAYQGQLPTWVKARSFAYYLVAFQGANGIGALAIGAVAQAWGVRTGLLVVAGGLLVCLAVTARLPLPGRLDPEALSSEPLPLPADQELPVQQGPVSVTVEYVLAPGMEAGFLAHVAELRRLRRRTGAIHWHLHRDLDDPNIFTEQFIVGSWEEHERQHARIQHVDQELLAAIDAELAPGHPRVARHAIGVAPPRALRADRPA